MKCKKSGVECFEGGLFNLFLLKHVQPGSKYFFSFLGHTELSLSIIFSLAKILADYGVCSDLACNFLTEKTSVSCLLTCSSIGELNPHLQQNITESYLQINRTPHVKSTCLKTPGKLHGHEFMKPECRGHHSPLLASSVDAKV